MKQILILSAMSEELSLLLKRYTEQDYIRKGFLLEKAFSNAKLYFFVTGVGKKNVEKTLKKIIDFIPQMDFILFVGTAGAIISGLKIGDILVPAKLRDEGGATIELKNNSLIPLEVMGTILSAKKFVSKEEKKDLLLEADAVDMEAFFAAQFVKDMNENLFIIKAISDKFLSSLPDEKFIIKNYRKNTFLLIVKMFVLSPLNGFKMLIFKANIKKAIKSNSKYVSKLIDKHIKPFKF